MINTYITIELEGVLFSYDISFQYYEQGACYPYKTLCFGVLFVDKIENMLWFYCILNRLSVSEATICKIDTNACQVLYDIIKSGEKMCCAETSVDNFMLVNLWSGEGLRQSSGILKKCT